MSQDPPSITTLINTDVESCVAPSALLNAPEAFDPPPIALVGEPTVLTGHTSCTCSSSTGVAVRTFRSLFTSPASNNRSSGRSDQDTYTERLPPPLSAWSQYTGGIRRGKRWPSTGKSSGWHGTHRGTPPRSQDTNAHPVLPGIVAGLHGGADVDSAVVLLVTHGDGVSRGEKSELLRKHNMPRARHTGKRQPRLKMSLRLSSVSTSSNCNPWPPERPALARTRGTTASIAVAAGAEPRPAAGGPAAAAGLLARHPRRPAHASHVPWAPQLKITAHKLPPSEGTKPPTRTRIDFVPAARPHHSPSPHLGLEQLLPEHCARKRLSDVEASCKLNQKTKKVKKK